MEPFSQDSLYIVYLRIRDEAKGFYGSYYWFLSKSLSGY